MSVFVILGLLICIEAPGSSALTPVFVQTGKDVLLNVTNTDVLKEYLFGFWKFDETVLVTFFPDKEPDRVHERIEFNRENYSVKLKNLQVAHSGVYIARVITEKEEMKIAEYNVVVQDPVSPVCLTVDSVSSSSDSCNLTVTCRSQDAHISIIFRCDNKTYNQEGRQGSEVTVSGLSLRVHLVNESIICNHSNQVSWTEDVKMIGHFCPRPVGSEPVPAGISVCLVKTAVFSVGLIIMVSAVISVHIKEKLQQQR